MSKKRAAEPGRLGEEKKEQEELCSCFFKTKDKLDDATKRLFWDQFKDPATMTCCAYTDHNPGKEVTTRYFIIPTAFADVLGLSQMIYKWTSRRDYTSLTPLVYNGPSSSEFIMAFTILNQFLFYAIEINFDEIPRHKFSCSFTMKLSF